MSEKNSVEELPIPWKQEDFIASPAFQSAPLGGINEHSVDTSVVIWPRETPGRGKMVFIWGNPRKMSTYQSQGIQPVNKEYADRLKLRFASSSIDDKDGSLIYRDSKSVVLMWTTKENYERLRHNEAEAAWRCRGANKAFRAALDDMDSRGLEHGIPHFTQDVVTGDYTQEEIQGFVDMPRKKSPKVSMAGPKRAGSKVGTKPLAE